MFLAPPAASAEGLVMVAYLPTVANENATSVASAVNALAKRLAPGLPGQEITVSIFRRSEDAVAFLEANRSRVGLILADAPFLLDLPSGSDFVPALRFATSSGTTHRALVVVRADGPVLRLAHLKGKTLATVACPSRELNAYLARRIFDGLLDPAQWFSRLQQVQDDYAAAAAVLYGTADAALVSDQNSLVNAHLGKDLRSIFTGPAVPLPVLFVRRDLLNPEARRDLDRAASALGSSSEGRSVLADLRIEGLRPVAEGEGSLERAGLLKPPTTSLRALEVAFPASIPLPPPPPPKPEDLPFLLSVEKPSI